MKSYVVVPFELYFMDPGTFIKCHLLLQVPLQDACSLISSTKLTWKTTKSSGSLAEMTTTNMISAQYVTIFGGSYVQNVDSGATSQPGAHHTH